MSNDLYQRAVDLVLRNQKPSVSFVSTGLSISYVDSVSLVVRMEKEGVISRPNYRGKRVIFQGNNS